MVVYEYGIDFNSNLTFKDGDIKLIEYEDNMRQSILNRLNTDLDELNLFYEDYGSVLTSFLGWKRVDETLALIKLEIDTSLKKDPRIQWFETEVYFTENGVNIDITLYPAVLTVNLVLNEDGLTLNEE